MAEVLPLSESELKLLVVGLSAAALHGAPVVTEDVELWFEDLHDPKFLQALREVGAGYVPPFGNNSPMLASLNSEPFDVVISMSGLRPFANEFNRAVEIPVGRLRLKVLPLDRIVVSKTAANRPKDRLVLPVLRNAVHTLRVAESAAPKKRPPKRPKPKRKRRKRL